MGRKKPAVRREVGLSELIDGLMLLSALQQVALSELQVRLQNMQAEKRHRTRKRRT